jgi:anaerobic ribonucleoside-triphosphate reductase activating protein
MTSLLLNRLHYPVTTLGPGVRGGIWVQGCPIGCHGCMATDTWSAGPEHRIETGRVLAWLDTLARLDGVTISGGEPFEQPAAILEIVRGVRQRRPDADVLLYSGYPLSVLRRRPAARAVLEAADAVIAGPYVERRNPGGRWRGSSNQRLVTLSDRGRLRFAGADDAADAEPNLQVALDGRRVRVVGVPRRGQLERLEAELERTGLVLGEVSWRS